MAMVYVGMSGGVDSALSAALLLEQGYAVRGIYMRNWSKDLPGYACPWARDLADAERVAVALGIDLEVWDYEEQYRQTVVDYLVESYAKGLTPNPDVMCNQTIKFGTFLDRALAEGADYIATGHYARTQDGVLMRSANEHKDQTYFLWRVGREAFEKTLFPIGDYVTKDEVRAAVAQRGLGVERKPDSDGICFIGPVGIKTFLTQELALRPGPIVEWETHKQLGTHDGAFQFTIGQRQGLGLGGGPRRYVCKIDAAENTVYVTADPQCEALWTCRLSLEDCHWISGSVPAAGTYLVRTRHTGTLRSCRFEEPFVYFDEPVPAVAPGQSAVLYEGLVCLGGGIVSREPASVY